MNRLSTLLTLALFISTLAFAQVQFRNPPLNSTEPDGALAFAASMTDDPTAKIAELDEFLEQYADSIYRPNVLYMMLVAGNDAEQHEKALAAGQELMGIAPDDVEVRHRVNQALVALARWDELGPSMDATLPLAEADASAEGHQAEYASGVKDWLAWASNTALLGETDPAKKIGWLDRLNTNYADTEYGQNLAPKYIYAYQQAGDQANAVAWMQKAVDAGVEDETYRYSLAEDALTRQDNDSALAHATKALEILESKQPTEGMAADQWEAHKARMTAFANFAAGRAWAGRNTKPAYRTARTHLLASVDVLKAEGGPRYNVLAYVLGVCYVQLDIKGDNIRQATEWMSAAANTAGPYQAQAAEALKGIQAAQ
jgi:hypothetical protein